MSFLMAMVGGAAKQYLKEREDTIQARSERAAKQLELQTNWFTQASGMTYVPEVASFMQLPGADGVTPMYNENTISSLYMQDPSSTGLGVRNYGKEQYGQHTVELLSLRLPDGRHYGSFLEEMAQAHGPNSVYGRELSKLEGAILSNGIKLQQEYKTTDPTTGNEMFQSIASALGMEDMDEDQYAFTEKALTRIASMSLAEMRQRGVFPPRLKTQPIARNDGSIEFVNTDVRGTDGQPYSITDSFSDKQNQRVDALINNGAVAFGYGTRDPRRTARLNMQRSLLAYNPAYSIDMQLDVATAINSRFKDNTIQRGDGSNFYTPRPDLIKANLNSVFLAAPTDRKFSDTVEMFEMGMPEDFFFVPFSGAFTRGGAESKDLSSTNAFFKATGIDREKLNSRKAAVTSLRQTVKASRDLLKGGARTGAVAKTNEFLTGIRATVEGFIEQYRREGNQEAVDYYTDKLKSASFFGFKLSDDASETDIEAARNAALRLLVNEIGYHIARTLENPEGGGARLSHSDVENTKAGLALEKFLFNPRTADYVLKLVDDRANFEEQYLTIMLDARIPKKQSALFLSRTMYGTSDMLRVNTMSDDLNVMMAEFASSIEAQAKARGINLQQGTGIPTDGGSNITVTDEEDFFNQNQ